MPVFSIETPDKRTIDIEAADQAAAIAGAQDWVSQNPIKPGVAGRLDYLGNELTLGGLDVAQGAIRGLMSGKGVSKGIEEERAASRREAEQLGTAEKLAYGVLGAVPMVFGGPLSWGAKGAAMAARSAPSVARAGTALAQAAQTAKATMPPALASAASKLVPKSAVGQGIARGAAEGAAYGGIEGALRGTGAGEGALTGAALGGVLGGAAGKISQALTKPRYAKAQKAADLEAESRSLYDAARAAEVFVSRSATNDIVSNMLADSSKFMRDPYLSKESTKFVNDYLSKKIGKEQSLENIEDIRQAVVESLKTATGRDRGAFKSMRDALDKTVGNLPQNKFLTGGPKLAEIFPQARELWARKRRAEVIEKILDAAEITKQQFSVSGYDNALRTKFRQLSQNERKMAMFSPEEQDLIRKVAKGTMTGNALRMLGKLAPTGPVSAIPSVLVGGVKGIAMGAGGAAARALANTATSRYAQEALEAVRRGRAAQPLPRSAISQSVEGYVDPTRRLLTYGLLGQ